jgi:hypothetical protein
LRGSRLGPLVAAVLISGLAAAVLVSAAARRLTTGDLVGPVAEGSWAARTRAWFVPSGFHQAEFDATNFRHFIWTTNHSEITVPAIDRSRAYRVRFRIAAGRGPDTLPPPQIVATVDSVTRLRAETTNATQEYEVVAPAGSGHTLTVALDLSNTFVPSAEDRRALGVVVETVSIEPIDAKFRVLPGVLFLAALATMAYAAVAACCGFGAGWTLAIGLVAAALHAWLLALDAAFLGLFVERLVRIAAGAAVLGLIVGLLRRVWPGTTGAPEWPLAAGLSIVLGALKLAFFSHGAATIGDAVFQVHRAHYVLSGNYFFTSITPRPFFEFPYAIALYVTAMPFWSWFQGELGHVLLLRGLCIAADGLLGIAMFFALRRAWGDARPALAFAALWPFALAPIGTLCTANLTNHYGQAVFGMAMALAGWVASATRISVAAMLGVTALLAVGFLSHFSTISVGVPLAGLAAMSLFVFGRGTTRRLGLWLLAATLSAAAVSYVVYYSHFHDVYAKTIERVAAREGEAATRSMVAPVSVKAGRWLFEIRVLFGLPVLFAAVAGAAWLLRRHARDGLTLMLAGWTVTWLVFSALGIFTAVEMRASLAVAPLLLALATFSLGALSRVSRVGALAAAAVAIVIAWQGLSAWMLCLGR